MADGVASNRQINYAQTKSDLADLDCTTAAAECSPRSVGLQAAQQAFISMEQVNLFDLILPESCHTTIRVAVTIA